MPSQSSRPKAHPTNVLRGIDWEDYVRLRDHPGNGHLRMSYLDGTFIFMPSDFVHARYGRRLAMVIDSATEAWGINAEGIATTTLRRKGDGRRKGAAKESDYGFYFGKNAERMHRREELDLAVDPPPDLAIEVDSRADSTKTLKIYARLGVPEVWRYRPDLNSLWFGRLSGDTYESIDRSLALPRLTTEFVLLALVKIDELGNTEARPWIRDWARGLPYKVV